MHIEFKDSQKETCKGCPPWDGLLQKLLYFVHQITGAVVLVNLLSICLLLGRSNLGRKSQGVRHQPEKQLNEGCRETPKLTLGKGLVSHQSDEAGSVCVHRNPCSSGEAM